MDLNKMKAAISRCHDLPTLLALARHLKERLDIEQKADFARRHEAAWQRAKAWPVGSVVYCCCEGTFIGGDWQRGDSGTLSAIQPRAKRIWLDRNGKCYWFEPAGIHRHNLQLEPPAAPLNGQERAMADKMGEVLRSI